MRFLHFIKKITKITTGNGKKRLWYSISNILLIIIAFLSVYLIFYLSSNFNNAGSNFIWYIVGIIVAIIVGITSFLEGVITQVVLTIFSFLGIIISKERLLNFLAFLITIVSYIALIIAFIYLIQ